MADSISGASDRELLAIADQLRIKIMAAPEDFGLTAAYVTELSGAVSSFDVSLTNHESQHASAKAATADKDGKRTILDNLVRDARNFSKAAKIPESKQAEMGIPVSRVLSPTTVTVPNATIDTSERMKHTIHFRDAAALENKRKPRGVVGCEIWVKIDGPAPGNERIACS